MKKITNYLIIALIIAGFFAGTGCKKKHTAQSQNTKIKDELSLAKKENKNVLLFFLNPNGGPCKRQRAILDDIKNSVEQKVKYVYVSSLNSENNYYYYQYGVRSLPTVMLLNNKGKIAVRFSPGIIPKDVLLENIKKLKP